MLTHHGPDERSYATVSVNHHRETYDIDSRGFRDWLLQAFYKQHQRPPSDQALREALNILAARARYEGPQRKVSMRTAGHEGQVYIDLCNDRWQVVEVTADGWRVLDQSPVHFRRTAGMTELPLPAPTGDLGKLRPYMGLADPEFSLVCAYLVACFNPDGPYPILEIKGEQGSGKSTRSKQIRVLIDPSTVFGRTQPRNEQDLVIAAENAWLQVYDNLSGVPPWLSDALCRLSTGGGFGTRQLYSGREEELFFATRPILLNGIEDMATRPDLADRTITLNFKTIPESERKTEVEIWDAFNRDKPTIFAGILDALSEGLKNRGTVELDQLPRMADFTVHSVEAEPAFPVPPGTFLAAYEGNRQEALEASLESSCIGRCLLALLSDRGSWEGSMDDLLGQLREYLPTPHIPRDYPKTVQKLAQDLKRIMPLLRRYGITRTDFPRQARGVHFRLEITR